MGAVAVITAPGEELSDEDLGCWSLRRAAPTAAAGGAAPRVARESRGRQPGTPAAASMPRRRRASGRESSASTWPPWRRPVPVAGSPARTSSAPPPRPGRLGCRASDRSGRAGGRHEDRRAPGRPGGRDGDDRLPARAWRLAVNLGQRARRLRRDLPRRRRRPSRPRRQRQTVARVDRLLVPGLADAIGERHREAGAGARRPRRPLARRRNGAAARARPAEAGPRAGAGRQRRLSGRRSAANCSIGSNPSPRATRRAGCSSSSSRTGGSSSNAASTTCTRLAPPQAPTPRSRRLPRARSPGTGSNLVLVDRLGELEVPVLLVWGELDRVIPSTHAVAAATAMPDAPGSRSWRASATCRRSKQRRHSPRSSIAGWRRSRARDASGRWSASSPTRPRARTSGGSSPTARRSTTTRRSTSSGACCSVSTPPGSARSPISRTPTASSSGPPPRPRLA